MSDEKLAREVREALGAANDDALPVVGLVADVVAERDRLAGEVDGRIRKFAEAILHGDPEHKDWLIRAAEAFIAGDELPAPTGQGRAEAAEARIAALVAELEAKITDWKKIADAHVTQADGDRLRAERAESYIQRLESALEVPEVWSVEERDGLATAFENADGKHGRYETLFAVAAWILRHRRNRANG